MWELQSKSPFHRIKSWYSNRRRLSLWLNDDQIFSVYISFLFFSLLRHKNQLLSDLRACLIARIVLTQNTDNNLSIFVTTQLLMNIVSIICCTLTFKSSEIKYRSRMTVYVFSIDNFCFFLEMKKKGKHSKTDDQRKKKIKFVDIKSTICSKKKCVCAKPYTAEKLDLASESQSSEVYLHVLSIFFPSSNLTFVTLI